MKKFTVTAVSFSAVLGCLALAATASANHGTSGTMLNGGKDSGKTELSTEKSDSGHFELNAVEKGDAGHFDLATEKGDGGHIELSTLSGFGKKDGG